MENTEISKQIEGVLFFKGEPVTGHFLSVTLGATQEEIEKGLGILRNDLSNRGITLIQNGDSYMLGTKPEIAPLIEKLLKDKISKDLGKAGLETLAVVLYRSPVSRSEVSHLRGVNSSYIFRSLMVRGLVEEFEDTEKGTLCRPTLKLLSFMGISNVEDLPDYEQTKKIIDEFNQSYDSKEEEDEMGVLEE